VRARFSLSTTLTALIAATVLGTAGSAAEAAGTFTMTVTSPVPVRIGVDAIGGGYSGGGIYDIATCSNDPKVPTLGWDNVNGLTGTKYVPGSPTLLRFEMYPGVCGTYDGWDNIDPNKVNWGHVGGVHFEARTVSDYGNIVMPVDGQGGAFRIRGGILSSTPINNGRLSIDTFQINTAYPDPAAPQQNNGRVEYGAFATTSSRGAEWSGGVGWPGRYILFITDTVTGVKVTATPDIAPGAVPTIDLDAICFGFDTCTYGAGGPGTTAGSFHPTAPTRILDTRKPLGFWNPVPSGDGRHSSPDPITRRLSAANHDLQVTGRFGIPAAGVSAVLLNVTAVNAGMPSPGWMSIGPKPPRVGDIFNDQASYGAFATTSNLNIDNADPVPNLVLARVGAGGKIRISNLVGPTHVIADVAGWFGTGGAHTNGAGFEGVVPARVMDSRLGVGGPQARFAPGESRSIAVRGVAGVPRNAESVVVNITSVGSSRSGWVAAYPDGTALPEASNLNMSAGSVRANSAVVKIGANGAIRVFVAETDTDIVVDVLGSFGPYGGKVTAITPERFVDSRTGVGTERGKFAPYQTRSVQIAGRGSVPAGATAVIANVTATNPSSMGYLTAWPAGNQQPVASNLNFIAGQSVPNLVMLKLGAGGQVSIFNELGTTDVIVDVMGFVS
jgi:hypothetical protein